MAIQRHRSPSLYYEARLVDSSEKKKRLERKILKKISPEVDLASEAGRKLIKNLLRDSLSRAEPDELEIVSLESVRSDTMRYLATAFSSYDSGCYIRDHTKIKEDFILLGRT